MLSYFHIVHDVEKQDKLSIFENCKEEMDFFNRMINGSVKLIANNRDLVTKVYIPKYILLFAKSPEEINGLDLDISNPLLKKFINLYDGTLTFLELYTDKNIKLSVIVLWSLKLEILLIFIYYQLCF